MAVIEQRYETVAVTELSEHPDNPRAGDATLISESIGRHGFYGALVVQTSTGHVLAGNHRLQAARQQGITELPVIKVDCDDDLARRILLVDNRTAEVATWDYEQLASVLQDLQSVDDDLRALGWAEHELEALLGAEWKPEPGDLDLEDYSNAPSSGHTVKLDDDQWVIVSQAIDRAGQSGEAAALTMVCREWLAGDNG